MLAERSLIKLSAIDTSLTIRSREKPELNFSEMTNLSNFTSVVLFFPVAPLMIFKKFSGLMPNASFGLEYNLSKRVQIKIGGMGGILWDGSSADAGVFPFVGLNFLR